MLSRGFKQSLLISAFFAAVAAPVYAQTATEAAEPAAPAVAQAEPGLGSISGTVSKVTTSGFTLTHDRGDTPVLVSAQTERGEIGALKDGDKVTVVGKVNAEAKAIEARSITRVQSSASAAGASAAAGASTSASAAPVGATASEAEPSAQAAASAAAAKPSTVSEAEPTAQSAAAPSQVAVAQPSAPMDPEVVARLKLSTEADLPPQVVSEVSDGKYSTADLNRAALMAMNAAPMPAVRASAPAAAPAAADSTAAEDRGAPPPVAPEESAPADEDTDQEPKDM